MNRFDKRVMEIEDRVGKLEHFMETVAREVGCLPDYNDSLPEMGNAHIIRAIQKLKQNTLVESDAAKQG